MGERLAVPREWVLNPESEYRFELDPGSSLAIKVCEHYFSNRHTDSSSLISLYVDKQKFLAQNSSRGRRFSSTKSAKPLCLHGKDAR